MYKFRISKNRIDNLFMIREENFSCTDYFKDKIYSNKPFEMLIKKYKEKLSWYLTIIKDNQSIKFKLVACPLCLRRYYIKII